MYFKTKNFEFFGHFLTFFDLEYIFCFLTNYHDSFFYFVPLNV